MRGGLTTLYSSMTTSEYGAHAGPCRLPPVLKRPPSQCMPTRCVLLLLLLLLLLLSFAMAVAPAKSLTMPVMYSTKNPMVRRKNMTSWCRSCMA